MPAVLQVISLKLVIVSYNIALSCFKIYVIHYMKHILMVKLTYSPLSILICTKIHANLEINMTHTTNRYLATGGHNCYIILAIINTPIYTIVPYCAHLQPKDNNSLVWLDHACYSILSAKITYFRPSIRSSFYFHGRYLSSSVNC